MADKKEPKPFNKALLLILIGLMILTGSINTIFNKILQKLHGKGVIFEQHHWIITFGMFLGELVSIFVYIYIIFKRRKEELEKRDKALLDAQNGETTEKEVLDLEASIEKLKEDNEQIQRKINIIYEFRKKEGREEKNFYKESNINESTYADSLTSTAGLYNDLNSHKTKLDQDLKRYQASIDEQENRKQDVYEILMKYKEELLENAETRKGTKIPKQEVQNWLNREKKLEDDIRKLRIQSFTKSLEMNRLKKELKKMEDYFEGLHIIDFEQLKIENNTLTEKIEDRNEEIHKLKNKINNTVQVLAHLQEKSKFVSSENEIKKTENVKTHTNTGKAKHEVDKSAIVWRIKKIFGEKDYKLKSEIPLIPVANPEPWARAPISMEFNIPMFTASGLRVRYFHVVEKSNYKPLKWIRYVTKAGDFQFRI